MRAAVSGLGRARPDHRRSPPLRVAALAADVALVRRPELAARLEAFFASRGRALVEANLKQADLPEGATVLDNPIGTAAGFALELGHPDAPCWLFSMPGVPRELHQMMREQVEPRVREPGSRCTPIPRRVYRAIGSGESSVQQNVQAVLAQARDRSPGLANMFVHYRARNPEVQLILEATPGGEPSHESRGRQRAGTRAASTTRCARRSARRSTASATATRSRTTKPARASRGCS